MLVSPRLFMTALTVAALAAAPAFADGRKRPPRIAAPPPPALRTQEPPLPAPPVFVPPTPSGPTPINLKGDFNGGVGAGIDGGGYFGGGRTIVVNAGASSNATAVAFAFASASAFGGHSNSGHRGGGNRGGGCGCH
jgi:hypothetical protein